MATFDQLRRLYGFRLFHSKATGPFLTPLVSCLALSRSITRSLSLSICFSFLDSLLHSKCVGSEFAALILFSPFPSVPKSQAFPHFAVHGRVKGRKGGRKRNRDARDTSHNCDKRVNARGPLRLLVYRRYVKIVFADFCNPRSTDRPTAATFSRLQFFLASRFYLKLRSAERATIILVLPVFLKPMLSFTTK